MHLFITICEILLFPTGAQTKSGNNWRVPSNGRINYKARAPQGKFLWGVVWRWERLQSFAIPMYI